MKQKLKLEGKGAMSPFLILSNYRLKNLKYIIVAKYKKFIRKEYQRIYDKDSIDDMLFKVSQCPDCYLNGSCLKCGCDFKEFITTDKKCPDGKF